VVLQHGLIHEVGLALPVASAAAFLLFWLVRWAKKAAELNRRRRLADDWLLWGAVPTASSSLLSWRAGELLSPRLRATLARSLRHLEAEAAGRHFPRAVPLNVRAIRANADLVRMLGDRLEDSESPVSVRGMLLVDRLLTEPGSPLYAYGDPDGLADALAEVLFELCSQQTVRAA
jgi:hypothetical protein